MLLQGTVINGAIVLDDNEPLPEGARVEIGLKSPEPRRAESIPAKPKAASPLGEGLMKLAGTAVGLPDDMAAQHDHCLHGTPKR
ncbi:MAG TPA: hypothetical protein VFC46_10320 [Humisphaera sp.]|nr:hypothetical protein [Humisphaera sp.]